MSATEAMARGLVNRVVPPVGLDAAVGELTAALLAKSAAALAAGKRVFYRQLEMNLAAAYALASEEMARNMMLHDAAEGIDAFLERRQPAWRHE
jgi:enoyl-CoA hydratase/carnithine racemase